MLDPVRESDDPASTARTVCIRRRNHAHIEEGGEVIHVGVTTKVARSSTYVVLVAAVMFKFLIMETVVSLVIHSRADNGADKKLSTCQLMDAEIQQARWNVHRGVSTW
jgi:hypothetical protein